MIDKRILTSRSSMPPLEEYINEIEDLWETHWLTNRGVKHKTFEAELQAYLDVEYAMLFVNGHSALECALEAFELGCDGRDEVITTPFTFSSTTHAIVRKGLKPVFCDITRDDYTLDVSKIKNLISDRTCAILPVHIYGNICDTNAIQDIADQYGLKVIYDAAHAFGVKQNGIGVGNFGDASMFSFHATKVFNTIEGGAICISDKDLCDTFSQWRNFGITGPELVESVGCNAKMNEFCAAMGLCNLRHVDEEIAKRRYVFERYLENLENVQGFSLSVPQDGVAANYAYFPVVIDESVFGATRDDVFKALATRGIGARKYFYPLVSDYTCYRGMFNSDATPDAQWVADRVISLPMFADLDQKDVDHICSIAKKTAVS